MAVFYDALVINGPPSGVEYAVAELMKALANAGADVTFVCRRRLADAEPWLPKQKVVVAPWWAAGRAGRVLAEQLWLPRLGGRRDVIHGPAYVLPIRWRGPSVVTVYDLVALRFPQWTKPANARHYQAVVPASVRKADVVVVPSEHVAREIVEIIQVPASKIRVIPLGVRSAVRCGASAAAIERLSQRYGLSDRFFAVVGNIEPKKNIAGVVAAFDIAANHIPHELVLVGGKNWRSGPDMRAIAAARHRGRIRLLGRVSDDDLPALYARATAVVQWSLYEGFGMVPLEAMMCGSAAIVSDGGALPETAGPGAYVVPLGDPRDLAEAMIRVATDDAFRSQLVERGRKWAERFSWEAHAAAVMDIYEALA
ncbi:MAG: glycosyltransferase family 4 protein [Armatimonadetes bacterium]|nr:glycosyltransferase family 4 protein [Armatimonadota bacterium]